MSVVRLLLLVALTGAFAVPGAASAETIPPEAIELDVVSVNGSGCPPGTADVRMLGDNSGFRVSYREFVARAGGDVGATEFRKNCQINVVIHVPQGFTYAVASADYRGRARLEAGASAVQRTNYYFQGSPDNSYVDHPFSGPLFAPWQTTDRTSSEELVYAPCGEYRGLNLNTELRVYEGGANPNRVSSMSMRTTEGNIDTIVHFQWKQC